MYNLLQCETDIVRCTFGTVLIDMLQLAAFSSFVTYLGVYQNEKLCGLALLNILQ